MQQANHKDFRASGYISLWLGNFASENELDEYLDGRFPKEFGFVIHTPDGPEADVADEPEDILTLLKDYSRSSTFAEGVTQVASEKGWGKATTAIIFYNFKYDPSYIKVKKNAPVAFIGVFPYSGF